MKCFNHNINDAVGLCKHCSKALCLDCVADLEDGLACKEVHENAVMQLNSLINNNKRAYESQPKATLFVPIFYIFMGLVFVFFGIRVGMDKFALIFGAGFVIFGVAICIYNFFYFKRIKTNYKS